MRGKWRVEIRLGENQTDPEPANAAGNVSASGDRPREWSGPALDGLFRLAYRFLWNRADAEDAVHEAALIAHGRRHELRDPDRWWPWVCSIVVRQCHLLGRRGKRRLRLTRSLHEQGPQTVVDTTCEMDERARGIIAHLQSLPRRQREVLVLRHLQDMEFKEIAEVLGMSVETARVHAMRGREALLGKMTNRGSDDAM